MTGGEQHPQILGVADEHWPGGGVGDGHRVGVSLDDGPRGLPEGAFGEVPTFGVPLVIGAVILLGAATLCLVGRGAVLTAVPGRK